jgi:hypothetical protein
MQALLSTTAACGILSLRYHILIDPPVVIGIQRTLGMPTAVDQKTYWDLFETAQWICTRDEERVAAMWDMDEEKRIATAVYWMREPLTVPSLLVQRETNPSAGRGATPTGNVNSSRIGGLTARPNYPLDDLLRKVHGGRVRMTAIRCDGASNEQIPVPASELNDLRLEIIPGHAIARVGLWSRLLRVLVWRSPQFLRADVVAAWPAPNTKTAAVRGAVLHHLREIMIPGAPLTKREALARCLAEVPNAYPEAFKRAWAELEASSKRGRGKHGPRGH